jgi:hypothetical protein
MGPGIRNLRRPSLTVSIPSIEVQTTNYHLYTESRRPAAHRLAPTFRDHAAAIAEERTPLDHHITSPVSPAPVGAPAPTEALAPLNNHVVSPSSSVPLGAPTLHLHFAILTGSTVNDLIGWSTFLTVHAPLTTPLQPTSLLNSPC